MTHRLSTVGKVRGKWARFAALTLTGGLALGCSGADDLQGEGTGELSHALKLSATATASSQKTESLGAAAAVDGNGATRWSSAFSDPQWIRLDLGAVKSVSRIVLRWEAAYSSSYDIELSSDGTTFTRVYTDAAGNGGVDELAISGSARYVRLNSYRRGTPYGNSL